jgi:hypothetical protein
MRYGILVLVGAAVTGVAILTARPAAADKTFFEQFKAMYVKPGAKDRTTLIFNAAVEKKSCTICHGPKSKKTFNAYGTQVKKLLHKSDAGNTAKIKKALAAVSRLPSDPSDPSSPSFGKRIHAGKLPVGEIHVRPAEDSSKDDADKGK